MMNKNDINAAAEEYIDSAVRLLCSLIDHKSVAAEPEDGMPYGKDCAKALAFAQDILEKDGFAVRNFDNHAITADFCPEGVKEPELGILAHLDVVPTEGQAWSSDPFMAEIRDGRIYGRGAIDDKGPAAAVITAMRIIRDKGIKLTKGVRLILGSNEENGSTDMKYYTSKESFPPMLFTPDGEFPVINIEKGMIRCDMSAAIPTEGRCIRHIHGSGVYNAVPERAEAVISGFSADEVNSAIEKCAVNGVTISAEEKDGMISLTAVGKGAHASTPELGCNALTALMAVINELSPEGSAGVIMKELCRRFPYGEWDGSSVTLKTHDDKSGDLTLVLSRMDIENGRLTAGFDCRFPVCMTSNEIISVLSVAAAECGMEMNIPIASEPHCADEDSDMIRTLLDVYEDFTGEKGLCIAIGGGTYVHDTENGVAFGAEWSGENNMHGADEFIGIDELKKDIAIYTAAILRLCK